MPLTKVFQYIRHFLKKYLYNKSFYITLKMLSKLIITICHINHFCILLVVLILIS